MSPTTLFAARNTWWVEICINNPLANVPSGSYHVQLRNPDIGRATFASGTLFYRVFYQPFTKNIYHLH
ncbi:hypothetical protein [Geomicrobium sp. JCM 19055]|uniref:hypothetical protein n=1 Tax=Geomicrobium sp. JCM 19055 TaxID=1460649 RepID=UPI002235C19D|nr:hypothetical protein [Geomicrobium sp. JCM 19055]